MKYRIQKIGIILGFAVIALLCCGNESYDAAHKHHCPPLRYLDLDGEEIKFYSSERIDDLRIVQGYVEDFYRGKYEESQKRVEENQVALENKKAKEKAKAAKITQVSVVQNTSVSGGGVLTPAAGVNYYNGIKETYYNLPMGGVVNIAKGMGIEGDYWVRGDGVKMYGGYVIVAANFSQFPRGSIVGTSLGTGIVLDTGGMSVGWIDIAVSW